MIAPVGDVFDRSEFDFLELTNFRESESFHVDDFAFKTGRAHGIGTGRFKVVARSAAGFGQFAEFSFDPNLSDDRIKRRFADLKSERAYIHIALKKQRALDH